MISSVFAAASALAIAAAMSCSKDPGTVGPVINPNGKDDGQTAEVGKVGKALPAWNEGQLDIHFINTTAGECTFVIFPDGTQMLIDAAGSSAGTGAVGNTTNVSIRSRWDPTASSMLYGDFISEYIRHCMEWTGNNKLDYVMLTHFHNDHFGGAANLPASDKSKTYTKQSLPLILDNFKVGLMVDRGWPNYDYPFDMATKADNAANIANYITAVKWHAANNGLAVEQFKVGTDSQFALKYKASDYANCRVRNLAANGEIWNGSGSGTTKTFPELSAIKVANLASVANADNCPEENHCSCMVKISYGSFDYFGGGDAQYDGMSNFSWKDIETPVAKVCGQVEVMKADHHGTNNTNGYGYKDKAWAMKYLNPQVWVVNSWTDAHPRQVTFEGANGYNTTMDSYVTNISDAMKAYTGWTSRVKGGNGHVVIRVNKGGASYRVYVLSDSDRSYTVSYVSKEYKSR